MCHNTLILDMFALSQKNDLYFFVQYMNFKRYKLELVYICFVYVHLYMTGLLKMSDINIILFSPVFVCYSCCQNKIHLNGWL